MADPALPRLSARTLRVLRTALGSVVVLLLLFATDRAINSQHVLRGVWLGTLALGGLDRATTERRVSEIAHRLEARSLAVRVEERLFELDPRRVDFRIDVHRSVDDAFAEGRNHGFVSQLKWWIQRWWSIRTLALRGRLDRDKLEALLADWETQAIPDLPTPGGVAVDGARPIPIYPRLGRLIVRDRSVQALLEALESPRPALVQLPTAVLPPRVTRAEVDHAVERARALLSAPVVLTGSEPEARFEMSRVELGAALTSTAAGEHIELGLDRAELEKCLAPLRARVEREARDARFVVDDPEHVRIEPSQTGIHVDPDDVARALLAAASAAERRGTLPLAQSVPPSLTTEQAKALGIRHQVGHFTTHHACCEPRVSNIHRIADLIDHTLIRAGETYSVNRAIGARTFDKGFVSAPSIEDGEMVDSVGGGVSQFATTLFNAVYFAGLDIVERQAHSYWFSRYPMGHEATLGFPEPDLIFRNDSAAGLLIETSYTGTSITVDLYGDTGGRRTSVEVSGQREIVQPPVELEPDDGILPWREHTRYPGSAGWSVLVTRTVVFGDGTKKQEQRKVTYKPRARRVAVHPCRIPKGEPGYTGEPCPVPPDGSDAGPPDAQ